MAGGDTKLLYQKAVEQKTGKRIRLWEFKKQLEAAMELLDMDKSYAERDLKDRFSGGRKKESRDFTALNVKAKAGNS